MSNIFQLRYLSMGGLHDHIDIFDTIDAREGKNAADSIHPFSYYIVLYVLKTKEERLNSILFT